MSVLSAIYRRARDVLKSALMQDTYKQIKPCDVLLCCHDNSRGETLQGVCYSKFLDSVGDDLAARGFKCSHFALPFSLITGDKAWGSPVAANRRLFLSKVMEYLVCDSSIANAIPFKRWLITFALSGQEKFYENFLSHCHPKCVIAIGVPRAMCRAARKLGITVAELLHGYGYSPLPWGWGLEPESNLPDFVLSLDDTSTRTFYALCEKGVKVLQIPNPWYRRFTNPQFEAQLPSEWRDRPSWLPYNKRIILISLSWGYDGDHGEYTELQGILPNGLLPEPLLGVIRETHDTYYWLIRAHPVQLRCDRYKHQHRWLDDFVKINPNTEWRQSSVHAMPWLLRYSDGHITMISMSAYDAAFMGVPSLLLCPTLAENGCHSTMFRDIMKCGYATPGKIDAPTIHDWVINCRRKEKPFMSNPSDSWNDALIKLLGRACA